MYKSTNNSYGYNISLGGSSSNYCYKKISQYDMDGNLLASAEACYMKLPLSKIASSNHEDVNVYQEDNVTEILQKEIGIVFAEVLQDAGVYKCTKDGRDAFLRFVDFVNR